MKTIQPTELLCKSFSIFDKDWFLVSAGDYSSGRWNCMTISWGFLGTMWGKPVAQIVVRPQRYTREFLDTDDSFTLCAFPETYRDALKLLGVRSGRDGDKVAAAGLVPCSASVVRAPLFQEASLAIECRTLFRQEMSREAFLDESILKTMYPSDDRHIVYIGEVVAVHADEGNA